MRRYTRQAVVLLSFLITVPVLAAAAEIKGWTKAEWGMNEDQILQAFAGEAERIRPEPREWGVATIGIKKLPVDDMTFNVTFYFDRQTMRLSKVVLQCKESPHMDTPFEVEKRLIEKYGQPDLAKREDRLQVSWIRDKTIIDYFVASEKDLQFSPRRGQISYSERRIERTNNL